MEDEVCITFLRHGRSRADDEKVYETAKIIGQLLNVSIETDADWMELDNGPLAGMPRDVAAERYPKPDFRNPCEPIYSTGESEWEIYRRGARAVEKVVRRGAGIYV